MNLLRNCMNITYVYKTSEDCFPCPHTFEALLSVPTDSPLQTRNISYLKNTTIYRTVMQTFFEPTLTVNTVHSQPGVCKVTKPHRSPKTSIGTPPSDNNMPGKICTILVIQGQCCHKPRFSQCCLFKFRIMLVKWKCVLSMFLALKKYVFESNLQEKIGRCTFPVLTPAMEAKQTHFQLFSFWKASSVRKHLEEGVTIVWKSCTGGLNRHVSVYGISFKSLTLKDKNCACLLNRKISRALRQMELVRS